jgi:hypothetical protein
MGSAAASWELLHSQTHVHPIRIALVQALFLLAAIIFGNAWWTIRKKKVSGRWWGATACLLQIFAWASILPFGWHIVASWFAAFFWLWTLLGLIGLFVLFSPDKSSVAGGAPLNTHD